MSVDPVTGLEIPDVGFFEYGTKVAVSYLRSRLPFEVVVASQVPSPRPNRLVVVKGAATGGSMSLVYAKRRLIIDCYDTTEALACRMAEMVRGYLIDGVRRSDSGFRDASILGEPAYYPNPVDPLTPRAQLSVDLLLRSRYSPIDGSAS
jgi:hypothetical protein